MTILAQPRTIMLLPIWNHRFALSIHVIQPTTDEAEVRQLFKPKEDSAEGASNVGISPANKGFVDVQQDTHSNASSYRPTLRITTDLQDLP